MIVERSRFDTLYQRHLRALTLQGLSDKTIDVYSRAVRRVAQYYDCCPDQLTTEQLEAYFAELVASHSWSTVKVDRNGLQFFYKHVLNRNWSWVNIIKGHKDRLVPLPDLTCRALRALWCKHRNPRLLFPNPAGSPERIRNATTPMDRGGAQNALKVSLVLKVSRTSLLACVDVARRPAAPGRRHRLPVHASSAGYFRPQRNP